MALENGYLCHCDLLQSQQGVSYLLKPVFGC